MKKYLVAAALIGVIGFSGMSMANARGYGYGFGPGYSGCDGGRYCDNWSYSEKDEAKASAFLEETKETRKEIVVKRSELDALMLQDNPDEKKVAKLTGELYDLQTMMQEKADKTFEGRAGNGYGPGQGFGNCGKGRRGW
jgi:Spy/CpxP family protein refolding chaperone